MTSDLSSLVLVRTKLYRPRATNDLIHRARVCEILDRGRDNAVTLVCAPAGFGKTTLLSNWLEHSPWRSAWLSLDDGDGDLGVFLTYFVAAVRTLFPASCVDTTALLQAPILPPLEPLVTTLANDLDRLADDPVLPEGQRFILVLDDYHLVRGYEVHALLSGLLRHPPRSMHLILSTRQDPSFPLHALRGRGELSEIRAGQLRFTHEEVGAFAQQALGTPLDAGALSTLAERTEGWATGLRLAMLTVTAGGNLDGASLAADNRYVLDYLMNEVFARVPTATQDFLLKTSILGRLCGSLCDAVAGSVDPNWDGHAYLEWLAAENLFTFSLDGQATWYRYHHLFQTLLRNRLDRQYSLHAIAELHSRASTWFAEHGLVDEAIEHGLAGGNEDDVVQVVEHHRHEALNQERWRQLERWLGLLPRRLIDSRPELLMLEAWSLHARFRLADLPACLDRTAHVIEHTTLPETIRKRLGSELDTLRSQLFFWAADAERTLASARSALGAAPVESVYVRAAAVTYLAAALQMQGDLAAGVDTVRDALKEEALRGRTGQARLLMILCGMYWMAADPAKLVQTANSLLLVARESRLPDSLTRANFYLGCAEYVQGDLAAAEKHFGYVVEHRHEAYALISAQSAFGLAATYQAQGLPDRAQTALAVVMDYASSVDNPAILREAEAYGAHLALVQRRRAAAERWAGEATPQVRKGPMPLFYVPPFTLVEVLLAQGTRASLDEASRILARLRETVEATHNTRFLIETLAFQALLLQARGYTNEALTSLEQAVALAEPGRLTRVFVDLGPKVAGLLRLLARRGVSPQYLSELLAAFGGSQEFEPIPVQPSLIEPLSRRELEVLVLLGQRLSNKEIADALSIAPTTVKRHTVNIYQKLLAENRRDAIGKAVELGLLPAPEARPGRPS